jgi:FkbM family methyltransferase
MKKTFGFRFLPFEWAMRNRLISAAWRKIPAKIRFLIYQQFSLLSSEYEKLTGMLVDIMEDESAGFYESGKKDEALKFLKKNKMGIISPQLHEIWLQNDSENTSVFNFNGAFLPYSKDNFVMEDLRYVFIDTFLFSLLLKDNYSAALVKKLEKYMPEGPYSYADSGFDVTVKPGDTVIDAGAWIGDFSAYSAAKGATCYAFEPSVSIFKILQKTAALNTHGGGIIPVNIGLSDSDGEISLFVDKGSTGEQSTIIENRLGRAADTEKIQVTTLDKFVHDRNLKHVDFIKADIEGAERNMLSGAGGVLKEFAPKLALCTYHLADDPKVLEQLILDANPKYRVVHISKKLFAVC